MSTPKSDEAAPQPNGAVGSTTPFARLEFVNLESGGYRLMYLGSYVSQGGWLLTVGANKSSWTVPVPPDGLDSVMAVIQEVTDQT